jgi:tetratricopeptide (TPR) repeat protein
MQVRTITASRLALAVVVVAVAVAVGRSRTVPRPAPMPAAFAVAPAAAGGTSPAAARPVGNGNVEIPYIDKTPPPDDMAPSGVDFRAFRPNTDQAIRVFQERVDRNPRDVVSLAILGECFALKARESGDPGGYARAEDALRRALKQRPEYARARASLAMVLCSRHQFGEGLALARKVYDENPANLSALATIGDAQIELGRYQEARDAYQRLVGESPEPSSQARMARLAELTGQTEEALRLLRLAADAARRGGDPQDATWYQLRLGEIAFDAGRLDDAEAACRAALKENPEHREATADLGKVLAARGRHKEAIALLEQATAIVAEPATLALLGDLYTKIGQEAPARQAFDRLEQTAARYPEYRRELSLFYSEHDRQPSRALELAREELTVRPDIYGYDALAWALYRGSRFEEASRAMAEALKLGTRDARLFYHAGMIHLRLGDRASARSWLGRALALNPQFSLLDAAAARQTLATLGEPVESRTERDARTPSVPR